MIKRPRSVVFIDPCTPRPYDDTSPEKEALGGTEALVIRTAGGLGSPSHEVVVLQHNRTETVGAQYVSYAGFGAAEGLPKPDLVVVLRDAGFLAQARRMFPGARTALWLHDLNVPGRITVEQVQDTQVVCVSEWHAEQVRSTVRGMTYKPKVIYNSLDPALYAIRRPLNKRKIMFTSSPHKGLDQALTDFLLLNRRYPELELHVCNPGYLDFTPQELPGVVWLGKLPHKQVIEHLAESFCLFYPNQVFPETFGLVLAEANALGVPVLTYPVGAAAEVLYHPQECSHVPVLERFQQWYEEGRPEVRGKDEFKLPSVLRQWARLIG